MEGLRYIGKFKYGDLIRKIEKQAGIFAMTDTGYAFYVCDGESWNILKPNNVVHFKVKDRGQIKGRGYYTVIDNEEGVPITTSSTIRKKLDSLEIKGIEKLKGATGILPNWGLITNKKTEGDTITIDLDGVRTLDKILLGEV